VTHPAFLAKVVIAAGVNDVIIIREGGGDITCTLTPDTYTLKGDGAADDLLKAVTDALTAGGALTYAGTLLVDVLTGERCGYVQLTAGGSFDLRWAATSTTFDQALLGFTAANTGSAATHNSTLNPSCLWVSNDHTREIEPFSSRDAVVNRTLDGSAYGLARSALMQSWRIGLAFVHEERMSSARALASDEANTLEAFIEQWGVGGAFVLHEANATSGLLTLSSSTVVGAMHFSEETVTSFAPVRLGPGVPLYSIDLVTHSEVA